MNPLANKTVLVVGGASGIGLAIAEAAAEARATTLIAGRNVAKTEAAAGSIANAVPVIIDMLDSEAITSAFGPVERIDHLVLTAVSDELGRTAALCDIEDGQIERSFDKLRGYVKIMRSLAPRLPADGSVVMLCGASALKPPDGFALLAAESASIPGLTRAVAKECAPIRVNAIMAGVVDTPIHAGHRHSLKSWAEESLPLRRFGQPADIAHAGLFLMTNPYITGQVVVVDGGLTL